jgi:AraC-like DNA-binding protein/quercetin dioxygenase-like cupin family protein
MLALNDNNFQRKKEGFNGQKAIVLPNRVIETTESAEPGSCLSITDIGYYPRAKYHYHQRKSGCPQSILIYCSDGEGWIETERGRIAVEKDQFIIIPPGTPHVYGASEQQPWSIYWMHFTGTMSAHFDSLLSLQYTHVCRSIIFSEERIKLFDRIYQVLESGYSTDNIGYVNMCLWHFLSSFCYPDIFLLPQKNEYKDLIEIVIEFMQNNIHRPLQLHELASQIHISVSYFSVLFKKKTGYSALDYFNHIKIQKACQYLQFTDMHVKEIACKLGFDDPYYFSRLFNNMMGMPPGVYRNRKNCRTQPASKISL